MQVRKHVFSSRTIFPRLFFKIFTVIVINITIVIATINASDSTVSPSSSLGEPILVKRHELPLRHVDDMFRSAGGALIFGAWALRATLKQALHLRGDTRAQQHIWWPAAVYAAQAIVRSAMYELHGLGVIFSPRKWTTIARHAALDHLHPPHVMSDHVLLAATVVGGLALEVVVLHLSVARMQYHRSPVLLRGLAAVMTMFAVLVSAECYYTAKYVYFLVYYLFTVFYY